MNNMNNQIGNNIMNANSNFQQSNIANNQIGNQMNRPPPNQNVLDANLNNQNQLPNIAGNDPSMVSIASISFFVIDSTKLNKKGSLNF